MTHDRTIKKLSFLKYSTAIQQKTPIKNPHYIRFISLNCEKQANIPQILTTMATMKIAVANVPTAMYALCNPTVVPFEITALKLDSPKGRAWVVSASVSDTISFVFTTASRINSSTTEKKRQKKNICF